MLVSTANANNWVELIVKEGQQQKVTVVIDFVGSIDGVESDGVGDNFLSLGLGLNNSSQVSKTKLLDTHR